MISSKIIYNMIEHDITYPNIWAYNTIQYDIADYKWIVPMLRHHLVWYNILYSMLCHTVRCYAVGYYAIVWCTILLYGTFQSFFNMFKLDICFTTKAIANKSGPCPKSWAVKKPDEKLRSIRGWQQEVHRIPEDWRRIKRDVLTLKSSFEDL